MTSYGNPEFTPAAAARTGRCAAAAPGRGLLKGACAGRDRPPLCVKCPDSVATAPRGARARPLRLAVSCSGGFHVLRLSEDPRALRCCRCSPGLEVHPPRGQRAGSRGRKRPPPHGCPGLVGRGSGGCRGGGGGQRRDGAGAGSPAARQRRGGSRAEPRCRAGHWPGGVGTGAGVGEKPGTRTDAGGQVPGRRGDVTGCSGDLGRQLPSGREARAGGARVWTWGHDVLGPARACPGVCLAAVPVNRVTRAGITLTQMHRKRKVGRNPGFSPLGIQVRDDIRKNASVPFGPSPPGKIASLTWACRRVRIPVPRRADSVKVPQGDKPVPGRPATAGGGAAGGLWGGERGLPGPRGGRPAGAMLISAAVRGSSLYLCSASLCTHEPRFSSGEVLSRRI